VFEWNSISTEERERRKKERKGGGEWGWGNAMQRMDNPPLGQADLAPSLMGPMPKQHASRLHISLVTAIIVVMVFGVGALFSCCYHWGWRLQHNQTQRSGGMPDQSNLSNYVLEDPAATIPEHVTPQTTDSQKAQEMKQVYIWPQIVEFVPLICQLSIEVFLVAHSFILFYCFYFIFGVGFILPLVYYPSHVSIPLRAN
jgi:hypothetical protein